MPNAGNPPRLSGRRFATWSALLFLLMLTCVAVLVPSCQSHMMYFPRPYPDGRVDQWRQAPGGRALDFSTSQGQQRAFLQGNLRNPRNLWVVCGGNGTVALDWADWLDSHAPRQDAWLLVDFPGYGDCRGAPSPEHIRENFQSAVPMACKALGWDMRKDTSKLRFFGHSLGAAACMIAASEFGIQRGVLLAPFTSTPEVAERIIGLPVGFLVVHRFDNVARLRELSARGAGHVEIVHGTDDEVIPVDMGRKLAASNPGTAMFTEVPGGRHNDIQINHSGVIGKALREAGQP